MPSKRGKVNKRDAKPCDNVFANEICHGRTSCLTKGDGFNPL